MEKFVAPKAEFIDFAAEEIFTTGTSNCYECPNTYGSGCAGLPTDSE